MSIPNPDDLDPHLLAILQGHHPTPNGRDDASTLIDHIAHLLYPARDDETSREEHEREQFIERRQAALASGQLTGIDDALLDELRHLRHVKEEAERATRLLLAYARSIPQPLYRLRDLADATGMPIPTTRSKWGATELDEIRETLPLTDEQTQRLDQAWAKRHPTE